MEFLGLSEYGKLTLGKEELAFAAELEARKWELLDVSSP